MHYYHITYNATLLRDKLHLCSNTCNKRASYNASCWNLLLVLYSAFTARRLAKILKGVFCIFLQKAVVVVHVKIDQVAIPVTARREVAVNDVN